MKFWIISRFLCLDTDLFEQQRQNALISFKMICLFVAQQKPNLIWNLRAVCTSDKKSPILLIFQILAGNKSPESTNTHRDRSKVYHINPR